MSGRLSLIVNRAYYLTQKNKKLFGISFLICAAPVFNWHERRCRKNLANSESRPHSSPDPSCGREISRGKTKNPFPQKKRFSLCRVRIEAPRTAQKLLGQNPERKTPFPFSKEIPPPPNQKCKECFFFRGCWRTRQCVGLSPSVRFSFASPRTRSVRSHLFWK